MHAVGVRKEAQPVDDRLKRRPNESVVPPACQQIDPAEIPVSTTPACHAACRAASSPCTRHNASRLATLPPNTHTTSCSNKCAVVSATVGHREQRDMRRNETPRLGSLGQVVQGRLVITHRSSQKANTRRAAFDPGQVHREVGQRSELEASAQPSSDPPAGSEDRRLIGGHPPTVKRAHHVHNRLLRHRWPVGSLGADRTRRHQTVAAVEVMQNAP